MPGTQPFEAGTLNDPSACITCHGNYDSSVEPYHNWQGSMMAQASLDPIFKANMAIANQDAFTMLNVHLRPDAIGPARQRLAMRMQKHIKN